MAARKGKAMKAGVARILAPWQAIPFPELPKESMARIFANMNGRIILDVPQGLGKSSFVAGMSGRGVVRVKSRPAYEKEM
jgi:hypothetical protein